MTAAIRLLRPHQWTKNLLLVVPALAAHRAPGDTAVGLLAALVSFSALASGFYIVNDLLDLEHDRAHPTKRRRPLAAGDITPTAAMLLSAALVVGSLALALTLLPTSFAVALGVYATLTVSYSLGLKRVVLLDVLVLATLYTLRVVAGAAAVAVPLSRWFLAFSVFLFLSLALVKRAVELRGMAGGSGRRAEDVRASAPGRGWWISDLPVLQALGLGSAVASSLVYCLYITSDDVQTLYGRPDVLWLGLPLLLYWLGRVWILVSRDEVADDPVVFALRDPASWSVVVLFALTVLGAR